MAMQIKLSLAALDFNNTMYLEFPGEYYEVFWQKFNGACFFV